MRASLASCFVFLLLQDFSSGFPWESFERSGFLAEIENMVDSIEPQHLPLTPHLTIAATASVTKETIGEPLNPDDFHHATKISEETINPDEEDPTLKAGLFQGDIQLTDRDIPLLLHLDPKTVTLQLRNAVIDPNKTWPKATIPYLISASYDVNERATIANAMAAYHKYTCIRFVPRTAESDFIFITKGSGCSSAVGRSGGKQTVTLGDGCVYVGIIMHELMHAVGFWHEQSRADRDDYITIVWSNIQDGQRYNFDKYSWNMIQNLGASYDLGSVMHYGEKSFAKDRSKPTIIVKNGQSIGQRDNFSKLDITKLNKLYGCRIDGTPDTATTPPSPSVCQDNHKDCRYWASLDECKSNPQWMIPNCQLSCEQCSSIPKPLPICENKHVYCDAWAQIGECDVNPQYMKIFCVKACNSC